jgi:hypothetical protein
MKKFLLICVALIAFIATNASGGNQYQTDQLRTCFITQASPQIMPVYTFDANVAITPVNPIMTHVTATQTTYYSIIETDGWRAPKWIPSLAINYNSDQIKFRDDYVNGTIPIISTHNNVNKVNPTNYNVNHSYGLRY